MKRNGDWMQTYTGKKFWPLDPRPEDICIEDIAHALSNLCRFGGHCKRFYSVAEHSVLGSIHGPNYLKFEFLMHDASEAYIVDVPRPIKRFLTGYKNAEYQLEMAIRLKFGMGRSDLDAKAIRKLDNMMLATEAQQIMGNAPGNWHLAESPIGIEIQFWTPEIAEQMFLNRFNELTK